MKLRIIKRTDLLIEYYVQRKRWWGWSTIQRYISSVSDKTLLFDCNFGVEENAIKFAEVYSNGKGTIKYRGYTITLIDFCSPSYYTYAIIRNRGYCGAANIV